MKGLKGVNIESMIELNLTTDLANNIYYKYHLEGS